MWVWRKKENKKIPWVRRQIVTLRKSTSRLMKAHQTHPYQLPCSIMVSSQVRHTSPPSLLPLRHWNSFTSPTTAAHISLCKLTWRHCAIYTESAFILTMSTLPLMTLTIQVKFKVHLSRQFSIAFDVYIQICGVVDMMVSEALRHDSPDWELKNCCPVCMYTLQDEPPLLFKMLYAMDGNDSLKRVSHTLFTYDAPRSSELPTGQCVDTHHYYLLQTYAEDFSEKATSHCPMPKVKVPHEYCLFSKKY